MARSRGTLSRLWLLLALAGIVGASGAAATPRPAPPAVAEPTASRAAEAFVLSRVLAEEGRLGEARVALEEAIALAPTEPYLRAEAARFLLRLGRIVEAGQQAEEARRLAPDSADVLRVAGQVSMNLVERDPQAAARAIDAFEGLRRSRTGDLEALVSLGQLYLGAGRPGDAAVALREAARHHPRQPMVLALLAESTRQSGDLDGAVAALGELVAIDPSRPALRLQLADLLREQRRFREALEVLEGLAESDRLQPEVGMRLALARYQAGDLGEGAAELERLLAASPATPRGHDLLVLLRLADGRPAEAVAPALAAAVRSPEDADLELQAARVLALAGRSAEATERLAQLEARLAARGESALAAQVSLEHADMLQRAGHAEEALARIRALSPDVPEEARLAGRLAEVDLLVELGRHDEALGLLPADAAGPGERARRAAVLARSGREAEASVILGELAESGRPESLLAAAGALQELERHAEAVPILERLVAAAPDAARGHFQLGVALERSGAVDRAIASLQKATELQPDFAAALNYLAYLWADRGENLDEALRLAERAVALDMQSGAYVDTLGWALFRLGRLPEARRMLERAHRLAGDDPAILDHLGDLFLALGERDLARERWQLALAHGPERPEAIRDKLAALDGATPPN